MNKGNAVIEVLVLGFLAALVVIQATVAGARLQSAGDAATEAAHVAASWTAQYGDVSRAQAMALDIAPGARVDIAVSADRVRATTRLPVSVVGPEGGPITMTVTGRAEARISPYRSTP